MELVALAQDCGAKLGLHFGCQFVGGCSDGNFIQAYGVPVLDSMGACGDGAHTKSEYIFLDQYMQRIALLSALVCRM